jgi:hypothetical protein
VTRRANSDRTVHPNFVLHRLADDVRPNEKDIHLVRDRFGLVHRALSQAFPGSRFVPIGSHSRSTGIAVHSRVDFLAVLPSAWSKWGGHPVSPAAVIDRMTEYIDCLPSALAADLKRDCSGVEVYFKGTGFALNVIPGFMVGTADQHPVYSILGQSSRWIKTSPERHNAIFCNSNARSNAKLRAVSQLIKVWRYAHSPPLGISGLYIDMLLATSDVGTGVKSYGQCVRDFFGELVRERLTCLKDPVSFSDIIAPSPSKGAFERLYNAARIAVRHAQAALDAQAGGTYAEANCEWDAIFKQRLSRQLLIR